MTPREYKNLLHGFRVQERTILKLGAELKKVRRENTALKKRLIISAKFAKN